MMRVFVAVEVSDQVRRRAAELVQRIRIDEVKVSWVTADHLHLTLKFLGDIPVNETPNVCRAVSNAVQGRERFSCRCGGAGAFPRPSRPRTLWMGIDDGREPLVELHDAVDRALHAEGYAREPRRFAPHLTIGRVRSGGPALEELGRRVTDNADFDGGTFEVEGVTVFASELSRSGAEHSVLGRAPF